MEKVSKEKLQEWLRLLRETDYVLGAWHCNWSLRELEDFLKELLKELEEREKPSSQGE